MAKLSVPPTSQATMAARAPRRNAAGRTSPLPKSSSANPIPGAKVFPCMATALGCPVAERGDRQERGKMRRRYWSITIQESNCVFLHQRPINNQYRKNSVMVLHLHTLHPTQA